MSSNVDNKSSDVEDLVKIIVDSDESHIVEDIEPFNEGSEGALKSLMALMSSYKNYYENKNSTNISLRRKYFNCSFALIFILVFGFIGTTIIVCFCVKDNLAIIVSLVSSIGGLVPSVLVLPRIIGRYIFPENEYDGTKDVIESVSRANKESKKK